MMKRMEEASWRFQPRGAAAKLRAGSVCSVHAKSCESIGPLAWDRVQGGSERSKKSSKPGRRRTRGGWNTIDQEQEEEGGEKCMERCAAVVEEEEEKIERSGERREREGDRERGGERS